MASRKKTSSQHEHAQTYRWAIWAVVAGLWLLLAAALISHDPVDPPAHAFGVPNEAIQNWIGKAGAVVSHKAMLMLGPGIWLMMAGAAAWLVVMAMGRKVGQLPLRIIGVVLMAVSTSALAGVGLPALVDGYASQPQGAGGLIAMWTNDQLTARFAVLGTMLILAVVFWIGALLAADQWVLAIPLLLARSVGVFKRVPMPAVRRPDLRAVIAGVPMPKLGLAWPGASKACREARRSSRLTANVDDEELDEDDDTISEDAGGFAATESFDAPDRYEKRRRKKQRRAKQDEEQEEYEEEYEEVDETGDEDADEEYIDEQEQDASSDAPGAYLAEKTQKFDPRALRAKMAAMPINFAPKLPAQTEMVREVDLSGYTFPSMELLVEPEGDFTEEMDRIVRDQAVQLESALRQYKIEGEVVGIDSGPVITLFEVRLAPGTKVARLSAVDSDLARSLKAQNIRIVPNMAGKDTVGVEVPNLKKEKVRLKELMAAGGETASKMRLPMFLGKDASGNPLIQDLSAMPHMLIAGTTGSGKSVCMNAIIMSFLFTRRPDELKLVLVDPKMVEMSLFKDIPHLMCPVVTEMSKAAAILEWAVTKMDERYELLAEAGVRDIASYNALGWDEIKERMAPANEAEEARIPKKLPYLVFVIDELADLMMTNKEVEGSIVRIAQKARAVGIHLILATQRPQANVVTGLIKSNMPSRVAFKVASGMDSRIVIDQKGGELLLGHGDMLFLSPRSSKLTRAQGSLVDDMEVRMTVKALKNKAAQQFEPQLVQIKSGEAAELSDDRDPLFDQAVEIVLETQRGSVSLLQRRLTIGYSRASRLIEQMESSMILGGHKTAQAREVLISPEEWEAMKHQAAADAAEGTLYADTPAAETQADTPEADEAEADEVEDSMVVEEEVEEAEADDEEEEGEEVDEYEDVEDAADEEGDEEEEEADEEYEYEEEDQWEEVEDDDEEKTS